MIPLSGTWGWPWHGLCSAGMIALPNASTKAMMQPAHGSAWLYDLGLPAISRSVDQLAEDAALGYEWRNYGMISGGVIYGTSIGADTFIHVDAVGQCWLIALSYSFPEYSLQRIRITISIVRFGLFGEGEKTPVSVVLDVQCTYFTYISYGESYTGTVGTLEDVWTNGSRCLVSVARNKTGATPRVQDLYSLVELTITGTGGADGSGLVFDAVEVMRDTQLSAGSATADGLTVVSGLATGLSNTETVYYECVVGAPAGVYRELFFDLATPPPIELWLNSVFHTNWNYSQVYARFAYYNDAGQACAARLGTGYRTRFVYDGGSQSPVSGLYQGSCPSGTLNTIRSDAVMSVSGVRQWGVFLLENDTQIDALACRQTHQRVQDSILYGYGYGGYPSDLDFTGYGSSRGGIYDKVTDHDSSVTWEGSLSTLLDLGAPPVSFGPDDAPLAIGALASAWRDPSPSVISAEVDVVGSARLGLQRIDAKAAAFYKPGAARTYGNVLTPAGTKTLSTNPAGAIYFAWQRKTGEFTFSENPICYV